MSSLFPPYPPALLDASSMSGLAGLCGRPWRGPAIQGTKGGWATLLKMKAESKEIWGDARLPKQPARNVLTGWDPVSSVPRPLRPLLIKAVSVLGTRGPFLPAWALDHT